MANMTIYVKETNIWDKAREKAKEQGISFSHLVERAVAAYVNGGTQQTKLDRIQEILNDVAVVKDDQTQYCDHPCKDCDDALIAEMDRIEKHS